MNFRVPICIALTGIFSGCSSLPALEGGRISIVSGGKATPAVEELAKIDLAYQLDPKKKGFCHRPPPPNASASAPANVTIDSTTEIRCALDGFYSQEYFDELQSQERAALEVSNVTFAYAEKQASRIGDLTKKISDVVSKLDAQSVNVTLRDELIAKLRTNVLDAQVNDLTTRVQLATQNTAFLEFQRRKRNGVQSAFIAASDAACDLYKRNLNNIYSTSNFAFGSIATITGGLGAAVTSEGTSRALAAISGTTSGIRAEYNDAFFRNKVVELLTKAMDISRTRKKEEIRRRSVQLVSDYSMEDALGDSIIYNSQCSLVAGLQETSESLQTISDPGLKWLANAFGGAASNMSLTNALFKSLGDAVGTVQAIQKSTEDQNTVVPSTKSSEEQSPGTATSGSAASNKGSAAPAQTKLSNEAKPFVSTR